MLAVADDEAGKYDDNPPVHAGTNSGCKCRAWYTLQGQGGCHKRRVFATDCFRRETVPQMPYSDRLIGKKRTRLHWEKYMYTCDNAIVVESAVMGARGSSCYYVVSPHDTSKPSWPAEKINYLRRTDLDLVTLQAAFGCSISYCQIFYNSQGVANLYVVNLSYICRPGGE